jgi:6-phosphogluconolactonase (cycloisomerase 2 family)
MVRVPGTSTALVVGELSGRLLTLDEVRPGDFSILGDAPASGRPGPNHPSQLTLNSGGSMAYVANRGPDTIAAFDVSTTPAQLIAEQDTGAHPRHFALTDGQVLVGGQNDNSLNVHTIGPNGHLGAVIRYETFAPSCIAPKPDSIL